MGKSKGKHESDKQQYAGYKAGMHYAKNKKAKLERHIKKFPNDEQAALALKSVSAEPKRRTPNTYMWKPAQIELARMFAKVGLNGNIALGGKHEARHKEDVIGFGTPHALDQKKLKKGKNEKKDV